MLVTPLEDDRVVAGETTKRSYGQPFPASNRRHELNVCVACIGDGLVSSKQMTKTASKIRSKTKLFRPESAKSGSWTFLTLPESAGAKLPSRGMTAIEGIINGFPFQGTLGPDAQKR
jgi:Domain of unknown function (DUF1905)